MTRNDKIARTAVVVEDDADQRSLVTVLLEESEFTIIECESAEAALAAMRMRGDVALVFSDMRLAGLMDGVDLARESRNGGRSSPSFSRRSTRTTASRACRTTFLSSPSPGLRSTS